LLKLRKILLCKSFYLILLLFSFFITFIRINLTNYNFKYTIDDNLVIGTISKIKKDSDKLTLEIKGYEKIIGYYYFNDEDINYHLGDKVLLKGSLERPKHNTVFNLFDYHDYLKVKNIHFLMNIKSINLIKENKNIYYFIKNKINNFFNKNNKTKNYIIAFILGDTSLIDSNIKSNYQNIGISHLLAISGTQITFISNNLLKILKKIKIKEKIRYLITFIILTIYVLLIDCPPPVLRSYLFFILSAFNIIYYFHISQVNLFYLVLIISLFINPFIIYDLGFLYSYIISFFLIYFSNFYSNKKKIKQLLITSFISFLASFPITLKTSYKINLLSVIYNLFYIPYVNYLIFPGSVIVGFFPNKVFDNLYKIFINIMEKSSSYLVKITTFMFVLAKPTVFIIVLYYIFIFIFIYFFFKKRYLYLFPLIILLVTNYFYYDKSSYVLAIDVDQGDSLLIHDNKYNVLIDTGGKISFDNDQDYTISKNKLIPFFYSSGIKKIDVLVLSHGDYDHMGEAITLVENFKVEKVIFNCGEFNELEQDLIKVLDKKKIPYYKCIKELNIYDNKLYFLNNKDYGNENDNSSVVYTELNNHKFLFMGDAGVEVEEDLIEKYNLKDIDVLKVGHHGSKTSSSQDFINKIDPKYSIISVGKNNRYGHPNDSVLKNLEESKIYRTDQDGSIMLKIKNDKLKIETCAP